ncbi:MAG: SpoIID/LytB domain-containing protein [Nostocaceae cyanobacterium]|nr:SpoIID/LytB domain-containing protein [Nostocaceae cyanobacterium]
MLGLTGASDPATKSADVLLKVGIVQRFGDETTDKMLLEPTKGDRLRLTFKTGDKQQTLVTTKPVKLEVAMQPLAQPVLEERLVLGVYRSFETAEESAKQWVSRGIEVEISQPERWQVWAKRDVYSTPLLRRLLLQNAKAVGSKTAHLDTQILRQVPRVSWVVDGNRYSRDNLEITTDKNQVLVNQSKEPEKNPQRARLYPGRMQIQPNAYGTFTLVNEVPLETYLRGVVPYEIGANTDYAALEAQAIIARTYALRNLRRFAVDGYQLCADTHCQVYFGLKGVSDNTDKAIATTRGKVLTYNNELVDALYSANTGGVTANFSDVWNGPDRPYLRPLVDAANNTWNLQQQSLANEENFQRFINLEKGFNESSAKLFRWRRESSLEDITKGLQKFLRAKNSPYANFQRVEQMGVLERAAGGRILKLAVKTDRGMFTLHKDEVRSAFVAPISTLFYLQPLNKGQSSIWGYAFVGGGFGHGVGLSQNGAQELAKQGWSSTQILQFYYPGTQLQVFNEGIRK